MSTDPSLMARFVGYAMIAVGALIALLSGACTLYYVAMSLQQRVIGMIAVSLLVGAPFIAIGVALVLQGRRVSGRRDAKR